MNRSWPDLADIKIDDTWTASEGRLEGKPILVRARKNLHAIAGHPRFPRRLRIVWEFTPDNDSGMPRSDDLMLIQGCENLLVDALERDNHAVLTHVLMCDGRQQWVFYTSDVGESGRRINETLPHDPPYPIGLTVEPDVEWSEYRDTLRSVTR